jgi:hypothetical protein
MFEFDQILQFLKVEPGHGLLQSVLLLMIWLTSRGLRKDMKDIRDDLGQAKSLTNKRFEEHDKKLEDHEGRITNLEKSGA